MLPLDHCDLDIAQVIHEVQWRVTEPQHKNAAMLEVCIIWTKFELKCGSLTIPVPKIFADHVLRLAYTPHTTVL